MNYREYNPEHACLPAEAYPYLALALASPKQPRPTLWGRIMSTLRKYTLLPMGTFLPLADPPADHLYPPPDQNSLVWVQPRENADHPVLLPLVVEGNPYCL